VVHRPCRCRHLHITDDYGILAAFNPYYAVSFLFHEGYVGIVVLGAVFLTVTGAEALYADLGHFGRKPHPVGVDRSRLSGADAELSGAGRARARSNPEAMSDPFYLMFPEWALLPVVILATCATIIASPGRHHRRVLADAPGIHLGFLPRMAIFHLRNQDRADLPCRRQHAADVRRHAAGHRFGSSESLATAYGISVTGAMVVDTILAYEFVRVRWNWPLYLAIGTLLPASRCSK
jgi:KUP system potassium uptake protein